MQASRLARILRCEVPGRVQRTPRHLEGFWRKLFGYTHGVMVASAFYENVSLHDMQHRDRARREGTERHSGVSASAGAGDARRVLVVAFEQGDEELLSFAAITDEPPAEVTAAGHDRCIIPIKPENVDAWLNPDPKNLTVLYAILDDRARSYYEHRMAA